MSESSGRSYWLKSGLLTLMERGSVLLFGLVGLMILLRSLTKEEFGAWTLFLAVASLIEMGRTGLLQNGLVKYLTTATDENYDKISTASLVLNVVLTTLSILLILALAGPLSRTGMIDYPELETMFKIYAVTTLMLLPFQQFNFISQANLDFTGIFWSNFTKQGLFFLYITTLFVLGSKISIINLAIVQIFTAIVASYIAYRYARPYLRFSREIDWSWVNTLFQYGKYVFGTNISTMVYKITDKWMLGGLLGVTATGMYESVIRINNMIEAPTFSIAAIVFPQSARSNAKANKEEVCLMYERAVGAILALIVPAVIFVLIFPEFIMNILGGAEYIEAAPLLRLTVLYGIFFSFANQFGTILDSIGKPQINFVFVIIGTILNIIFNYLFIMKFGVVGAAYGTLCTYAVTFVLNQIVLYKMFGVKFWRVFGHGIFFYKEGYKMIKNKIAKQPQAATGKEFAIREKETTK